MTITSFATYSAHAVLPATRVDEITSTTTLRKGDTGEAVRTLNAKLASFGYGVNATSDSYSSGTVASVKSFQRSNGLYVDGVAGPRTLKALGLTTGTAPATPTTTTTPPVAAPPVGGVGSIQRMLKMGASGPDVRILNQRLAELHYMGANPDSDQFTEATYHAVMAFQKVQGIARDGAVGSQTINKLMDPITPDVSSAGGGTRVIVDISGQYAVWVSGGSIDKIVSASTGAAGSQLPDANGKYKFGEGKTPIGTFRVQSRLPGAHPNHLESMYYSNFFLRDFAIHGSHKVPAGPASGGCVRIPWDFAQTMYNQMSKGYTVEVRP